MNAAQLQKAAPKSHSEEYLIACAYAQGHNDAGRGPKVDPKLFGISYVNALKSWEKSDNRTKRWVGVAAFFKSYMRSVPDAA